ncbi:MAG: peptidylprolyl isomerase [Massilia sp.]
MTLKPARLLLALIAVAAMPVFAQNVAVVNGKAIPKSRADAIVQQVVAQGQRPDSPELQELVRQDLINREVLMQEAIKLGFDKGAAVKEQLNVARETLVISAMMRDYMDKHQIAEADVKAAYDTFAKEKANDKEFHVRHILLANEADAKAVIAKLKGGAKFEDLAKTSIDKGSSETGGDLDWLPLSALPKTFADGLAVMKKGEVTQVPVKTENGFHVIKVDDTRPAKVPTYDELKERIAQSLQDQRMQAYQAQLESKANVVIKK